MSLNNKQLAKNLRALADLVEKCKVKDNSSIEISQFAVPMDDPDGWTQYFQTGDISVQMSFNLYNPDVDQRGEMPKRIIDASEKDES